jgi:hypothetical protein
VKRLIMVVCAAALLAILVMIGCAGCGGSSGKDEGYYVTFTIDGDRNVTWTKGDTDVSSDAAAHDTGKGSIEIEAFPVEVSGVYNVDIDVDNGIALLIMGLEPGTYSGEDIQTEFALDGIGYDTESSGTIEITSIGGVGEVVEGTFNLSWTSPSALEITNGRFRVLLHE